MKMNHKLLLCIVLILLARCGTVNDDHGKPDSSGVAIDDVLMVADVVDMTALSDVSMTDDLVASPNDSIVVPNDTQSVDVGRQPTVLSAGRLEDIAMVPGGYGAYAQPGLTWFIQNDLARFYIQASDVSVGLNLYGGNIIDGVRLDADGSMSPDLFREMFPIVAFRIPTAAKIQVVNDGSAGDEVVLRVSGTDAKSKIVDLLDVLVGELAGAEIHTDYVMRPGIPGVLIRTVAADPKRVLGDLTTVLVGEMLAFGKTLRLFSPETGWDEPGKNGPTSVLVGVGDGVSYAYSRVSGTFTIPVVDSSGTVALYDPPNELNDSGQLIFERWFVVGTGDVASVLDPLRNLRGDRGVTVTGTVVDSETLLPISEASVSSREPGSLRVVNHAKTNKEGLFQMSIAPGDVEWVVSAEGRTRVISAVSSVTEPVALNFVMQPPGKLKLTLGGPAKISLLGVNVEGPEPLLGEADFGGQTLVLHHLDGDSPRAIKPGKYTATISRGPEYERVIAEIEIQPGVTTTYDGKLAQIIDTTGWMGADFHQHTVGSLDSEQPHLYKVKENLAEGVEIVATTDHDNTTDFGPAISALSAQKLIYSMVGNEISVNLVGHFNAYPLPLDPGDPYALVGAKLWAGRTVQELFTLLQKFRSNPIIHISHPRSGGKGYFTWLGLDPVTGLSTKADTPLAEGFDAVEVNAELGDPSLFVPEMDTTLAQWSKTGQNKVPVLRDWFGLLQAGKNVCALGNSDSHNFNDGSGYPRTYLQVNTDDPTQLTDDVITGAIRAQKAVVGRGIFVTLSIDGVPRIGHADPVEIEQGKPVDIEVRVQAPNWVSVGSLEVYENGRPLMLSIEEPGVIVPSTTDSNYDIVAPTVEPSAKSLDWQVIVRVTPTTNSWYVVVVRGNGDGKPVFDGQPFGFTNPIYVHPKK